MKMKVLWIFLICWGIPTYCPSWGLDSNFLTDLEVGDKCRNEKSEGECKLLKDCPFGEKQLADNPVHNLRVCGYEGDDQVICCPRPQSRRVEDKCGSPDLEGQCKLIEECPYIRQQLERNLLFNVKFCNSNRGQLVVCCRDRPAVEACNKINLKLKQATRHIIDGMVAEEGEFPHMAVLAYQQPEERQLSWECGASIISDQFLLTAAHCFKRLIPKKARLGINRLDDRNAQDFEIEDIFTHDLYNFETKHNDIALVKLKRKISFTNVTTPACLYTGKDDPNRMIVTGWGRTKLESLSMSNELQKALLKPQSRVECNDTYYSRTFAMKTVVGTQLCAKGVKGKSDACQGDSGGPLQIKDPTGESDKYFIVGVTSYGASCGGNVAGIYTRVASYLDWIEEKVWS